MRCMDEAHQHEKNIFITLTYDSENLHPDLSLHKSHFQKFIRALRKKTKQKIRYYMCGEYGQPSFENGGVARPHFHALLFNYDFPDKVFWTYSKAGDPQYTSNLLDEIWQKGFAQIGTCNLKSAAYIARYIMKKLTGPEAEKLNPETGLTHYETNHLHSGDVIQRLPEYTQMSLRPGIGAEFYEKYKKSLYPNDKRYVGNALDAAKKSRPVFLKPPKYYDKLLDKERPDMLEFVVENRVAYALEHEDNYTYNRLAAKKIIVKQRVEQLKRDL